MQASTRSVSRWAAAFGVSLAVTVSAAPAANETCWTSGPAQFANAVHYCVSSYLAPQSHNTYGPDKLANDGGAWCEGAAGPGIGETITIRVEGGPEFRRLLVRNGYDKSALTFTRNGRIKAVAITTDTGFTTTAQLADDSELRPLNLPGLAREWVRLQIVDVYPGAKFDDTCVSFLSPDFEHEEELLMQEQGLLPD